jgi:hypothetical protein
MGAGMGSGFSGESFHERTCALLLFEQMGLMNV